MLANRSAYGLRSSYIVPIGAVAMLFGAAGISSPRPTLQVASPDIVDRSATCLSPCIPAPEGLIAWWPFDEDTPGQNFNELIHDNDGIPVGNVMPVGGHVGNAAGFGFGFSAIKAAHIDPLDFNVDEDFSLAAWVYVPDGVDIVPMIDKRTSEGVDELGWTFGSSSGTLLLRATDTDGINHTWLTPSVVPTDAWVHVAVTVDRSLATGVRFFVNGLPVFQGDATLVPGKLTSGNDVRIGASHRNDGFPSPPSMRGGLDEIQIYHRALFDDEVFALANADCGGACKIRMHVSKITPFCDGQTSANAVITIDNPTDIDRSFDLTTAGLPGDQNSDYCVEFGPTTIQPGIANPINVPAGQSIEIPVVIDRPVDLIEDGDSACWTAHIEDLDSGVIMQRKGIVSVVGLICIEGETNGVIPMRVGQPVPVKFTIDNPTPNEYSTSWKIAAIESVTGLPNRVMRLNTEEPGAELYGYSVVQPFSSVQIIVQVTYLRQRTDEGDKEHSKYSDVAFYEDPGTDVPWESSDSVGSEPVGNPIDGDTSCGADINCDDVVDVSDLLAVIAAWGDCPTGGECPEDTNGDGVVDVTDLLAVIASWG